MACAIGLSRILREDRATKDGYDAKEPVLQAILKAKNARPLRPGVICIG